MLPAKILPANVCLGTPGCVRAATAPVSKSIRPLFGGRRRVGTGATDVTGATDGAGTALTVPWQHGVATATVEKQPHPVAQQLVQHDVQGVQHDVQGVQHCVQHPQRAARQRQPADADCTETNNSKSNTAITVPRRRITKSSY